MKIKHKLTGEITELSYVEWEEVYLPRNLNDTFVILDQDIVQVRIVKTNGGRENFKKFDRDIALEMIKAKPLEYDFVDINGEKIINGKRMPIDNPTFKVISKKGTGWVMQAKNIIIGILIAGLGGVLTFFLIKLFTK